MVDTLAVLLGVHEVPGTLQVVLQEAAVPLQAAGDVIPAVLQDLPGALPQLPAGREEAARVLVVTRDDLQQHGGAEEAVQAKCQKKKENRVHGELRQYSVHAEENEATGHWLVLFVQCTFLSQFSPNELILYLQLCL